MKPNIRRRVRVLLVAALAALSASVLAAGLRPPPRPRDRARATARLAVHRLRAGDAAGAGALAAAALAADPRCADARFLAACTAAAAGDGRAALDDLERAAALSPDDALLAFEAGLAAAALARIEPSAAPRARAAFAEASRRARAHLDAGAGDRRAALVDVAANLALGRLDEAERGLSALSVADDDALALRAALLAARGDDRGALALVRERLAAAPSDALRALADVLARRPSLRLCDAVLSLRGGDAAGARAALGDVPGLAALTLRAALVAGPDVSIRVAAEVQRLPESGPERPFLTGSVLLLHGDAAAALPLLERAFALAPHDPAALRGVVAAALALDDAGRAAARCRARIDAGDPSGEAEFLLGAVLEHDGRDDEAAEWLEAALAKDGRLWPASDRLAAILLARGDAAAARAVCDRALLADPACVPLRLRRAAAARAAGDAAGALSELRHVAAAAPRCVAARLALARELVPGDLAAADAEFRACLEAEPACAEAWLGRIAVAARTSRLPELAAEAAARPRDAAARFAAGVMAEAWGDRARAEREYAAALDLAPSFGAAANNLAWLLAADPRRLREAADLAERAGRLLPRDPHVLDTRGRLRLAAGDAARAERDLARAARALPERADVAARHAEAAAELRRSLADPCDLDPEKEVLR